MAGKTAAERDDFLGVLMLDTAFPRILGDAGNIKSYAYPARIHIVPGIGSLDVVSDEPLPAHVVEKFCQAARKLQQDGARAIISTCGFLITAQQQIAAAVHIPVMVSGLSLYPLVNAAVGNRKIGILTASKSSLSETVLAHAAIPTDNVTIAGLENCPAFSSVILQHKNKQRPDLDQKAIQKAVIDKAIGLQKETPDIAAIILECANLPPYADAIKNATGLPVFSILDGADLIWASSRCVHWEK